MFTQPVTGGFGWWWLHHGVLRFCVSDDSDELQAAEEAPRPGNRSKPVVDDACYSNRVKTQLGLLRLQAGYSKDLYFTGSRTGSTSRPRGGDIGGKPAKMYACDEPYMKRLSKPRLERELTGGILCNLVHKFVLHICPGVVDAAGLPRVS